MKIKKFKNLWLMGIILSIAILLFLELTKFISPQYVIKVAEIPEVVKFGEYVDSHLWAYYLFTSITSFSLGYFYCCACLRTKYLKFYEVIMIILYIIVSFISLKYIPNQYVYLNTIIIILLPTIMCCLRKNNSVKYLYSTALTFSIHTIAQVLSLDIRGISTIISYPNSATYLILTIDMFIWLVLLYNFYNFKENKNG